MPVARRSDTRLFDSRLFDILWALVAAAVITAGTAAAAVTQRDNPHLRHLGPAAYLLVALGGVALAFRNTAPTTTYAVTLGIGLFYEGAGYPGGPASLPITFVLYTIAGRGERQRALGLGLLAHVLLVGIRTLCVADSFESPLLVAFPTAVVSALYAGQITASRRARRIEAHRRAVEAERTREQDAQRRVVAERLRIARELHDVVAHNISMINVQATMGAHLIDERPAEAAAALVAIKHASKQTLRELRGILDVLRQSDENEPTSPAPVLGELETLVIGTNAAGLSTRLAVLGTPRQLPSTVEVAAFRIVQESLTNALRYAAPAETCVTVRYQPGSLLLEIVDDGHGAPDTSGSGHGIPGMRERAAAVGGTLEAGPQGGGGFAVRARLPIPAVTP